MIIRILEDSSLDEDEIILHCQEATPEIKQLHQTIGELVNHPTTIEAYKEQTLVFLDIRQIIFFETEDGAVWAHTATNMYKTSYKLYELEETLPRHYFRVSKSTIANANKVLSIDRNLTASSTITFSGSHKQTFVSRSYYKILKNYLEEKRNHHEKK